MRKYLFTLCCVLCLTAANAQVTTTISSGTNTVNVGATFNVPAGFFVNNGSYTDTTSPGAFNVNGGVVFSGSGTTTVYNLNFNSGASVLNSPVTVYHTVTIGAGDSLNANNNLVLHPGANLVVNGYIINNALGLVTNATVVTGTCPSYTSVLSTNVSGSVILYQWQSSPDSATWTNVAGATAATYTATVAATTFYRANITTTNSSFAEATRGIKLLFTGSIPGPIGGTASVCSGATTTLSDATAGGTWSSSNSSVASVGSVSGVVTGGGGSGTAIISYSTGCVPAATITVTVNALPTNITGTAVVCAGLTTTLNSTPAGGSWSNSDNTVATIDPSSGIVSAIAPGTTTITYITLTGCITTKVITVNLSPAAITGPSGVCAAGGTMTLDDAVGAGTWTSSSTAQASVGSSSGFVTGGATGTTVITYALSDGCSTTTTITVNPLPAAIGGVATVCAGSTTALTDAAGAWSSSNGTLATVGTSGIVSGVAAGTPTITFTAPTGCIATTVVTVNAIPAAITGTMSVCPGQTTLLEDINTGGTWSSSNTAQASVGSTGIVTGGTGGTTPTITYTLPGGCFTTAIVTVNSNPGAITGTMILCSGSSTVLTGGTPGGTWVSDNTAVATIGSSGTVTAVSVGFSNITYTLPTGCIATTAVGVDQLPTVTSATGNVTCRGVNSSVSAVPASGASINWFSAITSGTLLGTTNVLPVISPSVTTTYYAEAEDNNLSPLSTIFTGLITEPGEMFDMTILKSISLSSFDVRCDVGTFNVEIYYKTGTLVGSESNPAAWTLLTTIIGSSSGGVGNRNFPLPTPLNLFGGQTYAFYITGTIPGGGEVVYGDGVAVGNILASNADLQVKEGVSKDYPFTTTFSPRDANISVNYSKPSCSSSPRTAATLIVNPVPGAITGTATVCTGLTTALADTPASGTWSSSNTAQATVGTSGIVRGVSAGTPTISYTLSGGCNATKVVTINASPTEYTVTGGGGYCTGGSGLIIGVSNSQVGVNYQLFLGVSTVGAPVGGTGSAISFPAQTTIGTYTVVATNTTTSCVTNMSGAATITINPPPTAFSVTGGGGYCAGGTGTLVGLGGSQAGVNYQLIRGGSTLVGSPVSGTGSAISFGLQATAGTYTVSAMNVATSCTVNMTGSVTVTINPLPGTFTVTGGGSFCTGGSGVPVGISGSEIGVNYQVYNSATAVGGLVSGTGSSIASLVSATTGGTYSVKATNATTGCTSTMTGTVTVTALPLPTLHNVIGGGAYCIGGTGVHVYLDYSDVGINYQLYNGGSAVGSSIGGTLSGLDMGLETAVGTYTVVAANPTTTCTVNMTGSVVVTTNPLPAVSPITGGGGYCLGGPGVPVGVTTTQSGVNYQLLNGPTVMGAPVAGTGSSITFGLQTSAGTYYVRATNTTTGCTDSMSGPVTITINPLPTAITGTAAVCPGTTTTLNSTPAGGAWSSSNTSLATTGTGGVVTGVAAGNPIITYTTAGTGCITTLTITVNSTPPAIAGASSVCIGSTTTLTDATGGGTWASSSTTVATIGSTSGVVSGLTGSSTTTITYTATTGCTITKVVSVNLLPSGISGTLTVCTGSTTPLSDAGGGTWSSSNTLVATVGTAGTVSGIAAGTTNITYTLGTGCAMVSAVTVSTTPGAISGTNNVCSGLTTTLSDGTGGGAWSSSSATVASVGSTGVVTGGASGGTATITYTMPSGCFVVYPVTVNALPPAIGFSPFSLCTGNSTDLFDFDGSAGGAWSSSNTSIATIFDDFEGSGIHISIISAVAAGTTTITYSSGTGGCIATVIFTVNQTPAAIAGTPVVCSGLTTALSDATSGGGWSSANIAVATVSGTGIVTGGGTASTTTISYVMSSGCSSSVTVTVNTTPTTITGTLNVCTGLTTTLASSPAGGVWSSGNTSLATVGTSGIVTGVAAGTAVISYTLGAGCLASKPVTVSNTPAAITGVLSVCTGTTTALGDATSGGVWSSSNTAQAAVAAGGGIVVGISAGNPTITYTLGTGCIATAIATINASPAGMTFSPTGTGIISLKGGNGAFFSGDGGAATAAGIGNPIGVAIDAGGNIYIADNADNRVRKINTSGIISTFAGTGGAGSGGDGGPATAATFSGNIWGVAVDGAGNVYIGDQSGNKVRKVNASGIISTFAGGGGSFGDGGQATAAQLNFPSGVAVDGIGNVYVADEGNSRVRKISPSGVITTVAGNSGFGFGGDSGPATAATLNGPYGIALDGTGNLYIADDENFRIRKVNTSGIITTITGTGSLSFGGDGGAATSASITDVYGLSADNNGNVYLADYDDSRIRKINSAGIINTIAGNGSYGYAGEGGLATAALLGGPVGITTGPDGNLIYIDYDFSRVRKIIPASVCIGSSISLSDATGSGTWSSSNTALASVNGSGTVTGISPGLVTVAYTMSTGCASTTPVVADPNPPSISGSSNVCLGVTDPLSDGVSGGVWSSSSTTIATVNSSTGLVLGSGLGTSTISYTLPTGCLTSAPVTVNTQPAAITGATSVCTGASTGLTETTGGGSWSSSNTAFATVDGSGNVTGVFPGSLTIIYTLGSCTATWPMTVNQTPAAITGSHIVCIGSAITLSDASLGGAWSSSSTASATVTPLTGIVTGVATGTPNIIYTLPGGCTAAYVVSVDPLPTAITGTTVVCVQATTTLNSTPAGGTWSSGSTTLATVGSSSGIVSGVSAGSPVITYTIPTGCIVTKTVTVNPLPTLFTVSGGGAYCAGGVGLHVFLSGSQTGISYQLYNGTATAGSALAGTGSSLDFGLHVTTGTRKVVATNTTTGCIDTMTSSAFILANPAPTAYNVTSTATSYCAGGTGVHVGLISSNNGIKYQLYVGGSPLGSPKNGTTGVALDFGLETLAGTYTAIATDTLTGCTTNMTGSVTISITPLPTVFSMTGGGAYCFSGTGTHIGLSGSTLNVNYQLYNGGTAGPLVTGTGSPIDFGLITATGASYKTVATSLITGCSDTMSGTLTVTTNPLPAVVTVSGGGSYCSGGSGVAINLSGSTSGTNYQLYIGGTPIGIPAGGIGGAMSFPLQTAAGTYTVIATNTTTSCTNTMAGTATVTINPLPSTAFTITGGGGYCSGGAGTLIGISGSVVGTNYQLFRGATASTTMAGTGSAITYPLQTVAATYTIVASISSPSPTCTVNIPGSTTVLINPLPTAYNMTPSGSYCLGGTGVDVGLSNSDIGINYQLYLSGVATGVPVAGTGLPIDFGLQTLTGPYTVIATNASTLCTKTMTGTATVSTIALPAIFTVTGGGNYCAGGIGDSIGLNGSVTGTSYQLSDGGLVGSPVAGTGSPISFGRQTTAGSYIVTATSGSTTCTSNMLGSATIIISPLPTAYPVTGGGSYCAGSPGVDISLSLSDPGISYQLYKGGAAIGSAFAGTGSTHDFGLQTDSGTYTIIATNPTTLCTNTMTGSPIVSVNALPVVRTITGGGNYCAGGTGVHVGLSNSGGTTLSYQLYNGTTPVGLALTGTGAALDFGLETVTGTYKVVATNTSTGCTDTMAGSAVVSTSALPLVNTITGGGAYCSGGAGSIIGLSGSQAGVNYQLFNGGSPSGSAVAGTGSAIGFGLRSAAGTYTVVATNTTTGCMNTMAGTVSVTITPLPTAYILSGSGSYCSGGAGVGLSLSGSDIGVNYQLYNGTLPTGPIVAGTGSTLNMGLQTGSGTYTVKATNTVTGCMNIMTSSATVTINPAPTAFMTLGGGSYCVGLTGVDISLSGSAIGTNYQLYVGGTTAGSPLTGTGAGIDFGLETAPGIYIVKATTTVTGCSDTMSGSASVTINPLPTLFTVTGGGSYCAGGTGVDVELSGSVAGTNYQLYRGASPIGTMRPGTGTILDFGAQTVGGIYTIAATNTATSCPRNMADSVLVSINPLPAAFTVTGGGSYCSGGMGVTIGLGGSATGVNYRLYQDTSAVGSIVAGTGSAISFGLHTVAGTYTVVATNASTGCTNNMTSSASVSINPLPTVYMVTGSGSYCAGGAGVDVGLNASDTGINYQLYNGITTTGSPMAGTGSSLDFGPQTAAGIYTIVATNATTTCVMNMADSALISILPVPAVYSVTGGGSYCAGGVGVIVGLSGSNVGISYQIYNDTTAVGAPVSGTGFPLGLAYETYTGAYTVMATNTVTGCTSNMTGSASVSVNATPAVFVVTGGGGYCAGGTGVHIMLSGSASGVNYQLSNGSMTVGGAVSGTGSVIDFGAFTTAGVYTVVATNATTGCTSNMTSAASITINPLPTVYTVTGGGSYCAGTSGVAVNLSGSVSGISYQLYNGTSPAGSPVTGTGGAISFGLLLAPGTYTAVATDETTGCTMNMTGTATISINSLPGVYAVTGGGSYCAGGTGFHIGLSNSNTGINYQLYIGGSATVGSAAAGGGSSVDFGLQTTGGTYTVVATNTSTGCTDSMAGSAIITVNPLPNVYTVTGGGSYCAGGTGVPAGLSGSDTGISYQLYHEGIILSGAVAGTDSALHFGLQTLAGTYTVVATNVTTGCINNMADTATVTITPTVIPGVTIIASGGDTICAGASATFSALISNGGTSPGYQWYVNGSSMGTGSTYSYNPANHDTVGVTITSSATCPLPATASNSVMMSVLDTVLPTVSITATPGDTVCQGIAVTFSLTSAFGGTSPGYTWTLNGATVGTDPTFSYMPATGDVVFCSMASNYQCRIATHVTSNNIAMTVEAAVTPGVTITVNPTITINGVVYNDTLTAVVANGGFTPSYQWSVNGENIPGATNAVYIADSLPANDVVNCVVTNSNACGTFVGSNSTIITVSNVGVKQVVSVNSDIRLIPNPNNGTFTVKGTLGTTNDEEVTLEVTDMLGQSIYKETVTAHNGTLDEHVQLSKALANGMYLLNVSSASGNKVFHMVVEQ